MGLSIVSKSLIGFNDKLKDKSAAQDFTFNTLCVTACVYCLYIYIVSSDPTTEGTTTTTTVSPTTTITKQVIVEVTTMEGTRAASKIDSTCKIINF